jgi:glyoxylase-like metal-dependent hydrolase (beta-lactamase superfamily II)
MMKFKQIETPLSSNFVYVIADEDSKEAAVIDPSGMNKEVTATLEEWRDTLKYVIHTHGHGDHTGGTQSLLAQTGAKLVAHPGSPGHPTVTVRNNERLYLGKIELVFMHTPGHSYDSICIAAGKYLFTGDTLFIDECGYAEQVGGDSNLMWDSLLNKIMKLDDDYIVCPGHDLKASSKKMDTLGNQKKTNFALKPRTKEEFKAFMLAA